MSFLLLILIFTFSFHVYGQGIDVIVAPDVLRDYKIFINGRDPLAITDFQGKGSRRDVVELLLIQQALKRGGFSDEIKFVDGSSSYKRISMMINTGHVLMSANTIWLSDADPILSYRSVSTISNGEFEAGFYTLKSNEKTMNVSTLQDFKRLSGVSNKSWTVDWETLSNLNLKSLDNVPQWEIMVKMVNAKRVDFLLAPFQSSSDMSLLYEGIKLIPIPNIKIGLKGERVFIVSKKHPLGARTILALNKGLLEMKKNGVIRKAYEQSGFINTKVKNWKKIN